MTFFYVPIPKSGLTSGGRVNKFTDVTWQHYRGSKYFTKVHVAHLGMGKRASDWRIKG